MWVESGIQFRSNLLLCVGARIQLHKHDFPHVAMVTHGWLRVREIDADGNERQYQMSSKGFVPTRKDIEFSPVSYRVNIPAFHQHEFTVIECQGMPAEVLCMFPNQE